MSDAKGQQEPSMEEILASIRRIIAEDGETTAAPSSEERAAASQDDILELTEAVEEDGTVVSLKPAGARTRPAETSAESIPEAEPVAAPVEPPSFAAKMPETSFAPEPPGPDPVEREAFAPPLHSTAPERPMAAPAEAKAPEPPRAPAPARPASETPPGRPGAVSERLVSSATAAASVAALSQLADLGQRGQVGTAPLGDAGRTIESLVRELLRPILKDWLDANLAPVVERMVQEEIRRLAREAQDR